MNKTKIFVINAKNEFELVKKMNQMNEKRSFFASQPIQKNDGTWCCFIYYTPFKDTLKGGEKLK